MALGSTHPHPYYHSCVFMTDIYVTISLSTHSGDDTPQKDPGFRGTSALKSNKTGNEL